MINQTTQENSAPLGPSPKPLVSWRSVAAGFLISLLTMAALLGLGMALGGIGIDENFSVSGVGVFTGLWFLFSTILSIFIGSYYSARLSFYRVPMIGAANGLLIASLFIFFFMIQTFSTVSSIGSSTGALVGQTASQAGEMASQNSGVISSIAGYVEEQFLDLELRSSPQVVASGVASRLLNGNADGAQSYLAYQADIGSEEAQSRVAEFSTQAKSLMKDARVAAASALVSTGWSLFFLIILSAIAAVVGGFFGSRKIQADPMTESVAQLEVRHA